MGMVRVSTKQFQLLRKALAGRARKEMLLTCVAKIDSAIAHPGMCPPPVVKVRASLPPLRK